MDQIEKEFLLKRRRNKNQSSFIKNSVLNENPGLVVNDSLNENSKSILNFI